MNTISKNLRFNFMNLGPVILLYTLSITEVDTEFSNLFEILSFKLQLIIIYFWVIRQQSIMPNSHIFFAGIINDVVTGLPLGTSALSYLIVSFVASYVRSVTVKVNLMTDWFTFIFAVFFSNLSYFILLNNFSNISVTYTDIFYNSFFTILFYPVFWVFFNFYLGLITIRKHA